MDRLDALIAIDTLNSSINEDDDVELDINKKIGIEHFSKYLKINSIELLNFIPDVSTLYSNGYSKAIKDMDLNKDQSNKLPMSVEQLSLRSKEYILGYLDGIANYYEEFQN